MDIIATTAAFNFCLWCIIIQSMRQVMTKPEGALSDQPAHPLLFAAHIVRYLFLLYPKSKDSSLSLWLNRPVYVLSGRQSQR